MNSTRLESDAEVALSVVAMKGQLENMEDEDGWAVVQVPLHSWPIYLILGFGEHQYLIKLTTVLLFRYEVFTE
jgi:hypothetical protein